MKILIASDIHGSSYYCKKLMERIKQENVDYIYLLGDILYHGPRNDLPKEYNPKEVIQMLNSLDNIISVRGNCDAEVDQMVLNFSITSPIHSLTINNKNIYLTHGHLNDDGKQIKTKKEDIVICGHTHIQKIEERNEHIYINCGSVSIPKGDGYNGYIIISDKIYFKDLEGNIRNTYKW